MEEWTNDLFSNPYPRMTQKKDLTILERTPNVSMVVPPLDRPDALALFAASLPRDAHRDFLVALYRRSWPQLTPSDLENLKQVIQYPNTS